MLPSTRRSYISVWWRHISVYISPAQPNSPTSPPPVGKDTRRALGAAGDVEAGADHHVAAPAARQAPGQRHLEEVVRRVHTVLVQSAGRDMGVVSDTARCGMRKYTRTLAG